MQHTKFLDTPIEYLKGVGPVKGELLKKELGIFTFRDFLYHFPYRYIDKTRFHEIRDLHEQSGQVLLKGVLRRLPDFFQKSSQKKGLRQKISIPLSRRGFFACSQFLYNRS